MYIVSADGKKIVDTKNIIEYKITSYQLPITKGYPHCLTCTLLTGLEITMGHFATLKDANKELENLLKFITSGIGKDIYRL